MRRPAGTHLVVKRTFAIVISPDSDVVTSFTAGRQLVTTGKYSESILWDADASGQKEVLVPGIEVKIFEDKGKHPERGTGPAFMVPRKNVT